MKVKLTVFAISVLIVQSVYSQETYPEKILLRGDTFCLVTPGQVEELNVTYEYMRFYKEMSDTLRSVVVKQQRGIIAQENVLHNYEQQISIGGQISKKQDDMIKDYKYMDEYNNRRIRNLTWATRGLCLLSIVLGCVAISK